MCLRAHSICDQTEAGASDTALHLTCNGQAFLVICIAAVAAVVIFGGKKNKSKQPQADAYGFGGGQPVYSGHGGYGGQGGQPIANPMVR